MLTDYRPEPFTDFTNEKNRLEYEQVLQKVQKELGRDYGLIIGGENSDRKQNCICEPCSKDPSYWFCFQGGSTVQKKR